MSTFGDDHGELPSHNMEKPATTDDASGPTYDIEEDQFESCIICNIQYHTSNEEGMVETPVMTACGHVFGNRCLDM